MKIIVNANVSTGPYVDPTIWQNSTLRYAPPKDFPAYCAQIIGRAKIMRTFITLDEYWDYRTDTVYPDYDIGVARYPVEKLYHPYDWGSVVPAPSGTRFHAYLTSHAAAADELLLNVRRLEREVSDGIITYEQYEAIFEQAVAYCKEIAPNIRYIECCNEIEGIRFGKLTAEEYVKIYLCAYRAIKRLNKKHKYQMPLEIGGYSSASPLGRWELMQEVMAGLKKTEIGNNPMDFYSYHIYAASATGSMVGAGRIEEAELSDIDKMKLILRQHNELLDELGLPEKPVFLNELGRSRNTGIAADSLFNASGIITYLNAFSMGEMPGMYPFPWCTFHNPKLQISYTQFLLNENGSYSATPNGMAIQMMHELSGNRLETSVTGFGKDISYAAVAVRNGDTIDVVCTNHTGESVVCDLVIKGMDDGEYHVEIWPVSETENNCVTGKGNGKLEKLREDIITAKNGELRYCKAFVKYVFVHYRFTPKK